MDMEPLTASTMAGDKEILHVQQGNSETVNDTDNPVVDENFDIDQSTAAKLNSDVGKTVVENENLCSRMSSDSTSTLTSSSNNNNKSGSASESESTVCNNENDLNSSKVSVNDDVSNNSGHSNDETAKPDSCEQSTAQVGDAHTEDHSKQDDDCKADAILNEPVKQAENPAADASEEGLNDSVAGASCSDVNVDEDRLLKDNDGTVVAKKLSQSTAAAISDVDVNDSDTTTDNKQQKILSENDASNKDLCDDSNMSTAVGRDQGDSNPPFGVDETSANLSETGACSGSESEHQTERTRFLHCDDMVSQYDDNMDTNEANAVDPFAQTTEELEKTTNETSDEPMDVDSNAEQNKDVDNVEIAQTNISETDVTEIAAKSESNSDETRHLETETPDKPDASDSEKNKMCSDSDGKTDEEVVKENKESDEADKISDEAKKDDSAMETEVDTRSNHKTDDAISDKDGDQGKGDSESGGKTNDFAVAEKPVNSDGPLETGGDEDVCIIPDTVPRVPSESEETINNKLRSILNKEVTTDYQASGRPQRQAAKTANAQIKATVHQLNEFEGEKENEGEGENSVPSIGSTDVKSTQQNQQACQQCCRKRVCKFKILSQGKVLSYLCSETCTNKYQENINQHMQASRAKKEAEKKDDPSSKGTTASADGDKLPDKGADLTADPSQTESDSTITVNDVEEITAITSETTKEKDSSGGVASVSASMKRPTRRVNDDGEFVRICSECSTDIKQDERTLSWETMDFCNEGCLGKYQTSLGSHCSYCKKSVQQMSLGKYCVRFGYDIRQFCCASCLEEFKKGLKVCSYCQKDISSSVEGFLAPVGDKGQFKDFCTQECMEKYDQMSTNHRPPPETYPCDVCKNKKLVQVQVLMESKVNKLCSEVCFAAFKFVNTIKVDQCDMCRKYFDRANVSTENFSIYYEDAQHNFCCKTCMNVYILAKRKIVPCNWCKVKKYNFDMIKRILENKQVLMMCSLNCLTLYQVSVNAVSSRRIKCDSCSQVSQAQYHLTMSDATIRNFCNYNCVMKFQGQYSKSPITLPGGPIPTGVPKRVIPSSPVTVNNTAVATLPVSNDVSGVPVISSVTSLAGQNGSHVPSDGATAGGAKQLNSVQMMNGPGSGAPVPISLSTATTAVPAAPGGVAPIVHSSSGPGTPSPYHVVVKPAQPTKVSNKLVQCRPYMHTKGVSCRPHASAKHTQTDEEYVPDGQKVLIPIPVPIYVPVPMHMYTLPTPVPMPVPLPVPVPVFIPTTRGSAKGIINEIKKIQEKIPADPFEAELLMMAEMVAEQKKQEETSDSDDDNVDAGSPGSPGGASPGRSASATAQTGGPDVSANNGDAVSGGNAAFSSGEAMEATSSNAFGTEDMLQMALKMATEMDDQSNSSSAANVAVDLEAELPPSTIAAQIRPNHTDGENEEDVDDPEPVMRESRGRKRAGRPPGSGAGRRSTSGSAATPPVKRTRKSSTVVAEPPPPPPVIQIPVEKPDANMCLKFTFGVNAWKQWVNAKNVELERSNATAAPNKKMKLFKTDILQLTADELNYALCLFVKEARKPNGTTYAPDTIYYFCLGIQQYLFENGRIDNIFTDTYYEKFTDCLDEVAKVFSEISDDSKLIVTRVEEEHLWESKQLGAHSPHVLLSTLMFFNTKHFNLTSVEEHMQLSFSHIMKHWKRNTNPPGPVPGGGANSNKVAPGSRNVLLRFYPPQSALDANAKKKKVYEQQENEDNPLRCPVKLYEFYLSKCPESVKTRNDVFYLLPERSCVPDSPVWYSTMALGKEALLKMLHRVKMVKEINIALRSA